MKQCTKGYCVIDKFVRVDELSVWMMDVHHSSGFSNLLPFSCPFRAELALQVVKSSTVYAKCTSNANATDGRSASDQDR
jgi:hypothetical protein